MSKMKKVILAGLLLATLLVLSRFLSIKTTLVVISFSFVPIIMSAIWLGPKYSTLIAGLGDLIGALLFPFGTYFPGFTLSAALSGLLYGLFLYRKSNQEIKEKKFILKLVISSILGLGLINILLTSFWLHLLYGEAYIAIIITRVIAQAIMLPIQILVIYLLDRMTRPIMKKYFMEEIEEQEDGEKKIDINAYLSQFQMTTEKPTLAAMVWMMKKFDNPHLKCKMIHVAGTNGKGSVVEMLNRILIDQGYQVGKYISPSLERFNERICVNDNEILDKEIEEIIEKMKPLIEKYNQTHKIPFKHFEVVTCLAFLYFAQKQCDFVVLETGMGGTWDCTNIVKPILSIITSVGYDHMSILGNTLRKIAEKKAGIIKSNTETIFLELEDEKENQEVLPVIKEKARKEKSGLFLIQRDSISQYHYDQDYQYFDFEGYHQVATNLKGKIQIYNTAIALKTIAILQQKGYVIEEKKMLASLKKVKHPARFEVLHKKPLILYDGAHNMPAIQNFRKNMDQYYPDKKRVYIVSILKTKDYERILRYLLQEQDTVIYVTDGNQRDNYVSKEELYDICLKYAKGNIIKKKKLKEAIQTACKTYPDSVICLIGSFYIYGDVISSIHKIEKKIEKRSRLKNK